MLFRFGKVFWLGIWLIGLVVACKQQPSLTPSPEVTIAVWDLEDLSPQKTQLPLWGEALSAEIIQTLKEVGFRVVERERLLAILEELHLGTTALVDEETRLKLGRLAGARYMVFGAYQSVGSQTRLDLRLVEVESGRVLSTAHRVLETQDPGAWLKDLRTLTKELVSGN